MPTAGFLKYQYIDGGWDWAASSHTYAASADFAAIAALSRAFVRVAGTFHTSGGPYNSAADVANDVFGLTAYFTATNALLTKQQKSTATYLGFGLEIWEFVGEVGGPNEFIVRAQGEATGDVTGLTGIVNPARCVPFLTGIRSSLATANAQEMTGYLTLDSDGTALRFHRGGGGSGTTTYSYAIVEFVGSAWNVDHVVATGLSGASGTITVPNVGDWAHAFIEGQWAAPNSAANNQISARIDPGANTTSVDWLTGASVSGAALGLHIARNPLINVNHGTITKASPSPQGSWTQTVTTIPSQARAGMLATAANNDSGTGYVKHAKQGEIKTGTSIGFWGSQGGGQLDVAYQVIDFGQETTPAILTTPSAVAAAGAVAATLLLGGQVIADAGDATATGAVSATLVFGGQVIDAGDVTATGVVAATLLLDGEINADAGEATATGVVAATLLLGGSIVSSPSPAVADGLVNEPTFLGEGVVVLTPGAVIALGSVNVPTLEAGGLLVLTPAAATALADISAPSVQLSGEVIVAPSPAVALGMVGDPEVPDIVLTPAAVAALAAIGGGTVDIDGAIFVTPLAAIARTDVRIEFFITEAPTLVQRALLDVTFILDDPEFSVPFSVARNTTTLNEYGENTFAEQLFAAAGVIQPATGEWLEVLEEAERARSTLLVFTRFPLRQVTDTTRADEIIWKGARWLVWKVFSFENWGQGYVQAVCLHTQPRQRL